jgi:hypothetical protein
MAAIDDLKSAWETEIGKISDTLLKAKATYQLDNYIAAVQQQASLEANDIISYSIAGRTFTRRDVGAGQDAIAAMENELVLLCYGRANYVDFNVRTTEINTGS